VVSETKRERRQADALLPQLGEKERNAEPLFTLQRGTGTGEETKIRKGGRSARRNVKRMLEYFGIGNAIERKQESTSQIRTI